MRIKNVSVGVGRQVIYEGQRYRIKSIGPFKVTLFNPFSGSERKVPKKDLCRRCVLVEEGIADLKRACDIVPAPEYSEAGTEYLTAHHDDLAPQSGVVHLGTLKAVYDPEHKTQPQPRSNYIGPIKAVYDNRVSD